MTAVEWNQKFGISGIAEIVEGLGGLPKIRITTSAATADIYLHGAQVTSWQPAGESEVLFLSQYSRWEEGRAIRGGIPICFPWFRAKADAPKAPSHGFVRTTAWSIESIVKESENVIVSLVFASNDATRQLWPYDFHLTHRITIGAALKLELITQNTGSTAFSIEEALHTYFRVANAEKARVSGLEGVTFLDNVHDNREEIQQGDLLMTGSTDNAYLATTSSASIFDPELDRTLITEKTGSRTTVAWNPWQQGASLLADLGDEEWRQMICVEASNILSEKVEIAPGIKHAMTATLRVG